MSNKPYNGTPATSGKKKKKGKKEPRAIPKNQVQAIEQAVRKDEKARSTGYGSGGRSIDAATKELSRTERKVNKSGLPEYKVDPFYERATKAYRAALKDNNHIGRPPNFKVFLTTAQSPQGNPPVRSPVQVNQETTERTGLATAVTEDEIEIPTGKSLNLVTWPGHGKMPETSSDASGGFNLDPQSNHAMVQRINSTGSDLWSVGPCPTDERPCCVGAYWVGDADSDLASNIAGPAPIPGVTTVPTPITTLNPLPYMAEAGQGRHTRWRCTGVEVSVVMESILGEVVVRSAMPSTQNPPPIAEQTFQKFYGADPSYRVETLTAIAGKVERKWIVPFQADQLAFWHTLPETNAHEGAYQYNNLALQIDNSGADALKVLVSSVLHWEMGGKNLYAVTIPTTQSPAYSGPVNRASMVSRVLGSGQHLLAAAIDTVTTEAQNLAMHPLKVLSNATKVGYAL